MALRVRVTQGLVSQWESGKSEITGRDLYLLADLFQCSMDELATPIRERAHKQGSSETPTH